MSNPMRADPTSEGGAPAAPSAPELIAPRTPEHQVATRIVATLAARNLVAPEQSDALRGQIAAGALTPDDWIQIARRAVALDSDDDPSEGGRDD